VILANVPEVAFGGTVAAGVDPFDGRLDLLTVPRLGTLSVITTVARMLTSSLGHAKGVSHTTTSSPVRVESDGEVPFQLDGEPVGVLPVDVRVEPGAVRLLLT
jgi:diacylglycerol kinase family enzyme